MSLDILLGMLAIAAFSLLGFGLLASVGLINRLPPRARRAVTVIGWVIYALLFSAWLYRALLSERGPVANGYLSEPVATAAWVAISVLVAGLTARKILRTSSQSNDQSGTGASA